MNDYYPNIGERFTYGGNTRSFGVSRENRRQHTHIVGRSGLGKTTLLEHLIVQDIEAGEGVAFLDPHGDSADKLLNSIPPERIKDVIYFNPLDAAMPIGFNLLKQDNSLDQHLVASTIVSAFKHLWHDSWGPRLEYILSNTIQTLLDVGQGQASFLSVQKLLVDDNYRHRIVRRTQDPVLRAFWLREFDQYRLNLRTEAIAPIQNKVGRLLSSSLMRNILCQPRSTINFSSIMTGRKIFIANLSKGLLGEDKSHLLGSLLVVAFYLAAMQRAEMPEGDRQDFYCYIDEFHNFGGDTFASILSEARKYRLALTLAHQYLDQLQTPLQSAIFGNVGTLMSFGVGPEDAARMSTALEPYRPDVLTSLDRGQICVRTLGHDHQTETFRAQVRPVNVTTHGRGAAVIKHSRRCHGRSRDRVERKLNRWLSV